MKQLRARLLSVSLAIGLPIALPAYAGSIEWNFSITLKGAGTGGADLTDTGVITTQDTVTVDQSPGVGTPGVGLSGFRVTAITNDPSSFPISFLGEDQPPAALPGRGTAVFNDNLLDPSGTPGHRTATVDTVGLGFTDAKGIDWAIFLESGSTLGWCNNSVVGDKIDCFSDANGTDPSGEALFSATEFQPVTGPNGESAIPEPSTAVVAGTGLLALGLIFRRRRHSGLRA